MFKDIGGTVGSVISGACCLGFAPLLALLSATGLGFLIRDTILIPLFVAFLSFTVWSLWTSRKRHAKSGPLYLGLASVVIVVPALWIAAPLAYAALAAFIGATVWDIVALRAVRGTACEAAPSV